MENSINRELNKIKRSIISHQPEQEIFSGVVDSFLNQIQPFVTKNKEYQNLGIIKRLFEPNRIIQFRISWLNEKGKEELNRGYRVQFTNALGPYKGGLRFHPSVNLDILKFLAFEQSLKNSLTGLQLGAAKGGADFNPADYNEQDVMRFCQAFAASFYTFTGKNEDVPAGDIGVGEREIGYIFGYTNKLKDSFGGDYTGKNYFSGGSKLRPQSTAYGCLYFLAEMFNYNNLKLNGKTVNISGSGNVALYACEKALDMGLKVQTLSDSSGVVYAKNGISSEMLDFTMKLKFEKRGRISELAEKYNLEFSEDKKPWNYPCDIALPCATQNELEKHDAENLKENGCIAVVEGANMPCTHDAVKVFHKINILYAPGKASNAGGVSVSAFEMAQNSTGYRWTIEKLEKRLKETMHTIHDQCVKYGGKVGKHPNYLKGADIGGFVRLYNAMRNQGVQ
ncbi:MAG: NADP-specific glutamate dehydrogenase [Saprospirales bacterium]|nr:MAG: NADP-specific glutamate dehydrogenase [Saprospirales bacterium]